ncbi:pseudouridine synthase [Hylemonella sp. W303a]|uniref:pseudouridine synthase n=1 Tax=Hylemonella sp. W303a TaxID=3389873 RepID=UPI00396B2EE1
MTRPAHRHRPPMIAGVSASCVALPGGGPWPLLVDFLAERLPAVGAAQWRQRMAAGRVLNEHGQSLPPDTPTASFAPGARVYYYRELDAEPELPFDAQIVFQDEHLLVADKPHFMPVTPTGRYVRNSLLVRLKSETGIETLSPVHRIDRETAGLVLFSVRPQDRGAYQALFRTQAVGKVYEAIAPLQARGSDQPLPAIHRSRIEVDPEHFFRQHEAAGEPNSETALELAEARPPHALYRLHPRSGKTHQLRVHMNALGRPIVGDLFYPKVVHGPEAGQDDWTQPLRLLARGLTFMDPITGQTRAFTSQRTLDWPGTAP